MSPAMHNAAYQELGLNNIYVAFEVEAVARALDGFRALGVGGERYHPSQTNGHSVSRLH